MNKITIYNVILLLGHYLTEKKSDSKYENSVINEGKQLDKHQ